MESTLKRRKRHRWCSQRCYLFTEGGGGGEAGEVSGGAIEGTVEEKGMQVALCFPTLQFDLDRERKKKMQLILLSSLNRVI